MERFHGAFCGNFANAERSAGDGLGIHLGSQTRGVVDQHDLKLGGALHGIKVQSRSGAAVGEGDGFHAHVQHLAGAAIDGGEQSAGGICGAGQGDTDGFAGTQVVHYDLVGRAIVSIDRGNGGNGGIGGILRNDLGDTETVDTAAGSVIAGDGHDTVGVGHINGNGIGVV